VTSTHALTKVTTLNQDDVLRLDLDPANSSVAETERGITADRLLGSVSNVKHFGAIGDGITDDTSAIQSAITSVASSGRLLYVPSGTYITSTAMTATARVRLLGEGFNRTIFKDDGSNVDFMDVTFPVEIEGIGFDGYTFAFEFVEVATRTGYEFLRCEFKNLTRALYASEVNSTGLKDFTVDFCRFDIIFDYAVFLEPKILSNVLISNSNFRTIGTNDIATGIQLGTNTASGNFRDTYKVINNDFLDIVTSSLNKETHAAIVYAGDGTSIITGNTIKNVSNGGTSGCEPLYTKARWSVVAHNVLTDAGRIEAGINIKGRARSEVGGSPFGYGGVCHDNIVIFTGSLAGTVGIAIQNENIHAHDNYVEGASLYGYRITKPSGVKFHHNTAYGGGGADNSNPYKGVFVEIAIACDNLELDYNTVEGFSYTGTGVAIGFDIQNAVATVASSIKVRDNTIKNNTFASGTFRAIQFFASDEDFEDPVITGNEIEQATIGIKLTGSNDILRLTLDKNRIGTAVTSPIEINVNDTLVGQEFVTATNVILASENGTTFYLNAAGGFTSTLPAPLVGLKYKFIVKTAPTTAYIIRTNVGANILQGTFLDIVGELVPITNQDTLNFVANVSLVGDSLIVESDGTNWYCTAFSLADGGITVSV